MKNKEKIKYNLRDPEFAADLLMVAELLCETLKEKTGEAYEAHIITQEQKNAPNRKKTRAKKKASLMEDA